MALLKNVQRTIIINAGHWDDPATPYIDDSGASYNGVVEGKQTMEIRNLLVQELTRRGYKVLSVPDNLDLRKSISWANQEAPNLNDALMIGIHLNYLSDHRARGSESFYGKSKTSKAIAESLTRNVSKSLGIPDRGAKPDTETAVGSLGIIRKTKMWASLIEVCFMTNVEDMKALLENDGHQKAAVGIANAIDELFIGNQKNTVTLSVGETVKVPDKLTIEPVKKEDILAQFTSMQLLIEVKKRILKLGRRRA